MTVYRSLPDDQREIYHEYTSYAFRPTEGPREYDPEDDDGTSLGSRRGLYPSDESDADPLCVCKQYWFDARVRGDVHPAPGLAAVASPPEHRRRGYVRDLLAGSLEEYREHGGRFSILWPFRYRFYRKYGWDTCNRRATYTCDPDELAFAAEAVETDGRFRRVEPDEWESIAPVYEEHAAGYGLTIERGEEWWRNRVFSGWQGDPFVYAWERDGEPRGYLVYEIDGDWGDRTMHVSELAFVDREAMFQLLRFCANHDSQVSTVRMDAPADFPLLDLASDPDDIHCEVEIGPMVRIVDVPETLAALSYPDVDAEIALAVDDPLVEWNDGTVELRVADGDARCEATTADPDARVDVAALSQLAVGYRSASELNRAGRLDANAAVVDRLDGLFPTTPVYLRDRF